MASESNSLELFGIEAIGGLALSGSMGKSTPQEPCALKLLGHRARVDRVLFVGPGSADTIHFAAVGTIVRRRTGLQALVSTRSPIDRDALLAGLQTDTLAVEGR